jgi:hypothetical protein
MLRIAYGFDFLGLERCIAVSVPALIFGKSAVLVDAHLLLIRYGPVI